MNNYIEVLKEMLPGITDEDLYVPISESGIHSLDSIILRDSLERYFSFEIPDNEWYAFKTLSAALAYCYNRKSIAECLPRTAAKFGAQREHEIKMPQMANNGLSENWLLKEIGDMHWQLLASGLQCKASDITDSFGNRLYAAFVRIKYAISPLDQFRENEMLHLQSQISRFGNYAYYSAVNGQCNNKAITATMMTSFSARKANDNAQIARSNPQEKINHVPELDATPNFYIEHRLMKKG